MSTPDTRSKAYRKTREAGEDTTLRRQVAHALLDDPQTTNELTQRLDHSANAIRPRVNELIRMGCVERSGTRENPSGHAAAVNHLTPAGRRYVNGDIDPEPGPTLAELKNEIVELSRQYLKGQVERERLAMALIKYDEMERRMEVDA